MDSDNMATARYNRGFVPVGAYPPSKAEAELNAQTGRPPWGEKEPQEIVVKPKSKKAMAAAAVPAVKIPKRRVRRQGDPVYPKQCTPFPSFQH